MSIEKINFSYPKGSLQSVYDTEEMTALELASKTSKKVDECVDLVNGVEQSAIEATAVVDEMRIAQEQFMTENSDIRDSLIADNQAYIDTLNASKLAFDNSMSASIASFDDDKATALSSFETAKTTALTNFTTDSANTLAEGEQSIDTFNADALLAKNTFNTDTTNLINAFNTSSASAIATFNTNGNNAIETINNTLDTNIAEATTAEINRLIADNTIPNLINDTLFGEINADIDTLNNIQPTKTDKDSIIVLAKDHGVKCDGITDDTVALNAILALYNNIQLPEGTTIITDTLQLRSQTTLKGIKGKTIIKMSPTMPLSKAMLYNETRTGLVDNYYDHDIIIENIIFDANNILDRTASPLTFGKVKDCIFKGITVKNSTSIALSLAGCYNVKIIESLFTNNGKGRPSIYSVPCIWVDLSSGSNSKEITIDNCAFIDNTWSGCYFMPDGGTIKNCRFVNCGESSIFSNANGNNISYLDNYIYGSVRSNISATGIETGANNIIIKGNKIYNCGDYGIALTDVHSAIVTDNICKNNGQDSSCVGLSGIGIITTLTDDRSPKDILIKNNICTDTQTTKTQKYGIYIRGAGNPLRNVEILDNIVSDNMSNSIFYAANNLGDNSYIKGNVGHSSLTPKIVSFQTPSVQGNYSITGVGFKPRRIRFMGVLTSTTNNYSFQSEVTKDGNILIANASDATTNYCTGSVTKAIYMVNGAGTVQTDATLVTMDSDGFTLNFANVTARPWIYAIVEP